MSKCKTNITKERKANNKTERSGSSPGADELTKALAVVKALESRCARLAAEKQTQYEELQTLQTQNEQLQTLLIKLEQHSTAQIKDLTSEVGELKTELAFFRSLNISI